MAMTTKQIARAVALREGRVNMKGKILAHNHVRHTVDMEHGANGFRYWFDWPPGSGKKSLYFAEVDNGKLPNYIVCHCGWRPDLGTHYRIKGIGSPNYRCDLIAKE